jgi:phosphatidylinositol glycan class N
MASRNTCLERKLQFYHLQAKEWNLEDLEMVNLNQTDLPPLVASLLDINMPSNSLGKLSTRVLNMTHKQVIKAKIANGMQIHEQVLSYQSYYGDTLLTSQAYGGLDLPSILSIVGRITQLQNNFAFQAASDLADDMYNICLDGLIYYQRYHRFPLYVAISVSYLGFIAYLGISLIKGSSQSSVLTPRNTLMVLIGLILTGLFTYFQNAPAHYFIYYSTPVFVLTLTYNELLFLLKSKSNNLSFPLLWNDFQQ